MNETRLATAGYRRFAWIAAMVLLSLLLVPTLSLAQGEGAILGTVKDSSGAVVPQVNVTLINTDTSETRTATTAEYGAFHFPALAAGHYSLRVEKQGFETQTQAGLTLEVAQEMVVNPVLKVGSSTQEVMVTGEAPTVNTTNSSLGGLISEQSMADLPLNGRNYSDLAFVQPGVTISANMTGSSSSGGLHGTWFVSDGGQTRMNLFTLDGANMTGVRGGGPASESGTSVGVAGIQEYKVVTGTFDASYGLEPSGQVVMVSKGGTNHFHGEVFEYIRNQHLDAANFFDKPLQANNFERLPLFQRNNFGVSGGGPIKKDKTFFFAAYEGVRQRLGRTIIDTVPDAGCHGPAGTLITSTACPQLGAGAASVTIAPVMTGMLGLYPVPNLPNHQYTFPVTSPTDEDWGQFRVDQNISASDTLFGRYTTDNSRQTLSSYNVFAAAGVAFPQFLAHYNGYEQFATISENHIFSPKVLNQLRFSYSRLRYSDQPFFPQGAANVTGPNYSFVAGQPIGTYSISGFSLVGPSGSQQGVPNYYVLTDDLYYTKGNHSLRFGMALNKYDLGLENLGGGAGSITFSSLANFLQGITANYKVVPGGLAAVNSSRNYWWWVPGFYAQDDWRVLPRLTLNLGLRYEFMTVLTDTAGRNYALVNRFTDAADTVGSTWAPFAKTHFSPRVGFAWDVRGDGKTSVRGGFGRYYDFNMMDTIDSNKNAQPGYDASRTDIGGIEPLTLPFTFLPTDLLSISEPNYHLKNPYLLKWNLAVQRELLAGIGLQVGYVGTRGVELDQVVEGNPTLPTGVVNGLPYWNGKEPRQNPNFSSDSFFTNSGGSSYNALEVVVNKRLSNGIQLQGSYTWSKLLDNAASGFSGDCSGASGMSIPDYAGPGANAFSYGPACADITHNVRTNVLYHIPNINSDNFAAKLEHGWWTGIIWSAQTGYPFTPVLGTNRSQSQIMGSQVDYVNVATSADAAACPAVTATCKFVPVPFNRSTVIEGTVTQWFNPNMFTMAPMVTAPGSTTVCTSTTCGTGTTYGTLGNASKGLLRGPGLDDVDFSINKDTAFPLFGEAGKIEFRAEIFNIMNHPNFNMPNGTVFSGSVKDYSPYSEAPSSSLGAITSTATTSRQIQFALKIAF